jgi:hypothetical protein
VGHIGMELAVCMFVCLAGNRIVSSLVKCLEGTEREYRHSSTVFLNSDGVGG